MKITDKVSRYIVGPTYYYPDDTLLVPEQYFQPKFMVRVTEAKEKPEKPTEKIVKTTLPEEPKEEANDTAEAILEFPEPTEEETVETSSVETEPPIEETTTSKRRKRRKTS